jgi:hypothetical protein
MVLASGLTLVCISVHPETNAQPSRSYVTPINFKRVTTSIASLPQRDRNLITLYLNGARRYVLTEPDGAFPHRGNEYWRNIAERGHGAAVMAALPSDWPEVLKTRCRTQSVAWVKEFTAQFKAKHDFGNAWQCSWWVGEMGVAAWFVWDQLDPASQNDVADMIIFHADRIADAMPGARVHNDTEAETVSWNSTILSLAVNMMPTHPHNSKWAEAAKRYVYTVFGTSVDKNDTTRGDDGKPIKDWVVGANINDDYSLENHNRFHIEYVFASYRFMIQDAALYRLAGNPLPMAFSHHIAEVHQEVVCKCMDAAKFAIFVSDNDWKRYHLWTESPAVHGYVALLKSSPFAAALEEESLRQATARWDEFPPDFEYDNRYVCGKPWTPRIADIVLLHLLLPPAPKPMPKAEVEAKLIGAHQKQDVNLLSQYSRAGSFRSFFWGPGPVVRYIEPGNNCWMLLPLSANYRPSINGKPSSEAGAKTVSDKGADWFWVLRSYTNGEHEAFVSLPDETVILMSSLPAAALKNAKTLDSFVATEKPHKKFDIYYAAGRATYRYGDSQWHRSDNAAGLDVSSTWINLDDSIGYVTVNLFGPSQMLLPKPGARSALSLFHATPLPGDQAFVIAAFPNQAHSRTKAVASEVSASTTNGLITCRAPGYFVWANFSDHETSIAIPTDLKSGSSMSASPHSVGILHQNGNAKTWTNLR